MGDLNGTPALGITHRLAAGNEDWPTAEPAAKVLGITRRTFDKLYTAGRIERYKDAKGVFHYNPADLDRLLAEKEGADSEAAWITENPTAALMLQCFQFNQTLMARTDAMLQTLIQSQREDNNLLRQRCTELESAQTRLIEAREQALDTAEERRTAAEVLRRSEDRKDKAVSEITKLGAIALGARESSKFFNSITPEQIALALKLEEMWTPEQMTILHKMAKARPYQEPTDTEEAQTSETQTPETQTAEPKKENSNG